MDIGTLKRLVYNANRALEKSGLVLFTFGNVSGVDRERGVMVIKPSGVSYADLSPRTMVAVSLKTGRIIDGDLRPSSDTPTHLEIYRAFPACGGVVHTHSAHCTALAQARLPVRCRGTTHADYFRGDVPVTRPLTRAETAGEYEKNTGLVIAGTFKRRDPVEISAVLVAYHGPFVWGETPGEAVHKAVVLERLAGMEIAVRAVNPEVPLPPRSLIDRHYNRKHGKNAYYGQRRM